MSPRYVLQTIWSRELNATDVVEVWVRVLIQCVCVRECVRIHEFVCVLLHLTCNNGVGERGRERKWCGGLV